MKNREPATCRLLLVDNLDDGLQKMETLLKRRYSHVERCENLAALKQSFEAGKYDIVIVALEMYGENGEEGYQCVDYIYQSNPDQRIITYSSEPERPSHELGCEACLKANRRHRLKKPILLKELYNEIENFDSLCCGFAETAIKKYGGYVDKM